MGTTADLEGLGDLVSSVANIRKCVSKRCKISASRKPRILQPSITLRAAGGLPPWIGTLRVVPPALPRPAPALLTHSSLVIESIAPFGGGPRQTHHLSHSSGSKTGSEEGETMSAMDRRAFLVRSTAVAGGLAIAGPFAAFRRESPQRSRCRHWLRPTRRHGRPLAPGGLPAPDHLAARRSDDRPRPRHGPPVPHAEPVRRDGSVSRSGTEDTILIRNHENRSRRGNFVAEETAVEVPNPYDPATRPRWRRTLQGRGMKLVVRNRAVVAVPPFLAETVPTAPADRRRGSWITCEEETGDGGTETAPILHGYIFEVDALRPPRSTHLHQGSGRSTTRRSSGITAPLPHRGPSLHRGESVPTASSPSPSRSRRAT